MVRTMHSWTSKLKASGRRDSRMPPCFLQCEGVQPTCIQQASHLTRSLLLQAWEGEKEEIRRENPWGGAWLINALGILDLSIWRHGHCSRGYLQMPCIIDQGEEWSGLRDHDWMDNIPHQLLPHSIGSDVPEGTRSSYHQPNSPSHLPADLVAIENRVPRW